MKYRTQTNTSTNINERTQHLFMFVCLTKRMKFLVRVCLFSKRTNTNELYAEQFTKCSPNVWFVYKPNFNNDITNYTKIFAVENKPSTE
ncbi:hypothetical protein HanXRQr2_Chr12g0544191 [Helianthus annuus]|uniref:Uncharacterized protein n=1 Tax=Helianthus annuus TaxID=4232 RepID=A0A251T2D5_HELAN|nr:hypothetical protein HanXRQr2_Chr12g0544191 [Helianthus annuus]KAJ0862923.1 hypothetical protein HanPSC8_Chr12g0523901 [Helianthus annuus]